MVLEKCNSLVAAVVGEYFEKVRPDLTHIRLHDNAACRNQLFFKYHAMGVDHEEAGHVRAHLTCQLLGKL